MRKLSTAVAAFCISALFLTGLEAADRFPRPEIGGAYQMPETTQPPPRPGGLEWLDLAVLAVVLGMTADFALRRRSRKGVFALLVFSLAYFGFWRHGCICSVGAIQNFCLAFSGSGYLIPLSVFLLFALPLAAALFFGRVFCAAACPLGAIQDLFALKPLKVPGGLEKIFGSLRCLALSIAVLLAVTASAFSICQHDPFVAFFRLSGRTEAVMAGVFMLGLGIFIARPYCRFLCPYGLILGWMSYLSKWHLKTSPGRCVNCGKCYNACPFGAVLPPAAKAGDTGGGLRRSIYLHGALLIVMVSAGAATGAWLGDPLSRMNPKVRLAEMVCEQESSGKRIISVDTEAFEKSGIPSAELYRQAAAVEEKFRIASAIIGGFLGLVLFLGVRASLAGRSNGFFEIDRTLCVSCGRCFEACPVKVKE